MDVSIFHWYMNTGSMFKIESGNIVMVMQWSASLTEDDGGWSNLVAEGRIFKTILNRVTDRIETSDIMTVLFATAIN